jgi:hydrogenase maturation protease
MGADRGSLVMEDRDQAQTLILACGNPSRGDDALGPSFVERLAPRIAESWGGTTLLTDFQLQIEHALDVKGHDRVILVDAILSGSGPFVYVPVRPTVDVSWSSHSVSPGVLLSLVQRITGETPPPTRLLGIRGYRFGLGEALSPRASANLDAALAFLSSRLGRPRGEQRFDRPRVGIE